MFLALDETLAVKLINYCPFGQLRKAGAFHCNARAKAGAFAYNGGMRPTYLFSKQVLK
jgi:hypothetical protein